MKFRKGDKVCALLIANRWSVDFTCFMGRLVKIEETPSVLKATILVTRYYGLYGGHEHDPKEFVLDIRLFKMMHWNAETKSKVKELRAASRTLHEMTKKLGHVNGTHTVLHGARG